MASRKKSAKNFAGDQILAAYLALNSCCCLGLLGVVSGAGLNSKFRASVQKAVSVEIPKEYKAFVLDSKVGLGIAIFGLILFVLMLMLIVSTWRSRKWAIWVVLLMNLPIAALTIVTGADNRISAILPIAVTVYTLLRVTGSVGPKL